jgi:hypothetical protein
VLKGGDTGESAVGNGRPSEYGPQVIVVMEKIWVGAAGGRRRAPCWVLKEQLRLLFQNRQVRPGLPYLLRKPVTVPGFGGGCWGCGLVVG